MIFDEDLSGSQVKKLETMIACKILDRSGIILDIFAKHARTAEAKVQVEVAQLEYMLPRLTNAWTHLVPPGGRRGHRHEGPGRNPARNRQAPGAQAHRRSQPQAREDGRTSAQAQHDRRIPTFHAALVGYTNAGKSTLMNALTRAGVEAADKLFATLDPTTRKVWLGPQKTAVVSDTVGFIRKLPVGLVSSFKSTLSVVAQATLILNVVDAERRGFRGTDGNHGAHPDRAGDRRTVPRVTVFNKIDLIDPERLEFLKVHHPQTIFISAEEKIGLDEPEGMRIREFSTKQAKLSTRADPGKRREPVPNPEMGRRTHPADD